MPPIAWFVIERLRDRHRRDRPTRRHRSDHDANLPRSPCDSGMSEAAGFVNGGLAVGESGLGESGLLGVGDEVVVFADARG